MDYRIIALLLVPCLIADPAAAGLGRTSQGNPVSIDRFPRVSGPARFDEEALSTHLAFFIQPFVQKPAAWVRRTRQFEVDHLVISGISFVGVGIALDLLWKYIFYGSPTPGPLRTLLVISGLMLIGVELELGYCLAPLVAVRISSWTQSSATAPITPRSSKIAA